MADNSDDEDALILDEEDQALILQDMEAGVSEVIIVPAGATDSTTDPDPTPGSSSSPDSPLSGAVPDFKFKKNTHQPYEYLFSETDYDFDKVNILQQSESLKTIDHRTIDREKDIFEATSNIEALIEDIILPE
ncbi:unnamed protein product [Parnassius apollo]|uniref:(apollo) hypothetical protein n=1 Tax=Parnassius apollo TaxID=110799 RepID=A0A8S3WD64_PARAO|nr:unnamed protein product [Parnassius apollo]